MRLLQSSAPRPQASRSLGTRSWAGLDGRLLLAALLTCTLLGADLAIPASAGEHLTLRWARSAAAHPALTWLGLYLILIGILNINLPKNEG